MVVRIRAKMAQRKKLAWPLRSSQLLLAVERLVANDGWVTSRVKAVSRRRRGPQARLYRACHPAILDHRGRRLTPATLLPPPSMRGFTPPVTQVLRTSCLDVCERGLSRNSRGRNARTVWRRATRQPTTRPHGDIARTSLRANARPATACCRASSEGRERWAFTGSLTAAYSHGYPLELKRALLGEMGRSNIEGLVQPEGVMVLR